ncbi:SAM50-like protein SPAC17C9.06 like [Verticillium longisporum]|nr:SAM50-like protein SPAC17C9.06 like [Verticillium longisporum]
MGIGAAAEPLVVVTLLFGGAWFNRSIGRDDTYDIQGWTDETVGQSEIKKSDDHGSPRQSGSMTPKSEDSFLSSSPTLGLLEEPLRRVRKIKFLKYERHITTPNTRIHQNRLLSRLLRKFPFLVEAWYWALIYWVYQVGRAITALTLVEGTVHVARRHALQVIHVEQSLHIFIEIPIQQFFLQYPTLMHWINRIYSFIHIPGTILFLVVLFYLTTTRRRRAISSKRNGNDAPVWSSAGPALYEARRRTMATCNLLAFVVFTLWPCMPPRRLSDPAYDGPDAEESKSFGFVDTVHSNTGESSVWTTNKFCNQYAAMPSLHFGYSLLIGLTIATLPIANLRTRSWKRIAIMALGMSYPALILTAIVATANHFVLDAVAAELSAPVASDPDRRIALEILSSAADKSWASHEEVLRGGSLRYQWLSPDRDMHSIEYTALWRQLTSLGPGASPTVRADAGDSLKSSLRHIFRRDTRDNPQLPQRGYHIRTTTELAGVGPLAGDVAFSKSELELGGAVPLSQRAPGVSLGAGLRLGALCPLPLGFASTAAIAPSRLNDRFQLGGPTDVRGFKLGGLGPHDGPDAVGGDVFAAGSLNLLFPLPYRGPDSALRMQLFANAGRLVALKPSAAAGGDKQGQGQGQGQSADMTPASVARGLAHAVGDLVSGPPSVAAGMGLVYAHPVARFELNFSLPLVVRRGEVGTKGVQVGVGINFL